MNQFRTITISYKSAPLSIREQVSMDDDIAAAFLRNCKDIFQLEDVLVLSTCNRTEVYYYSEFDLSAQLISYLSTLKGLTSTSISPYFLKFEGDNAIKHLFEVALGLDSMVLGDIQIINQVKRAYQLTADLNMCTAYLHRLLHTIFFTNKRIANQTVFKDGNASVASVSVEQTKKFIKNKINPKVAIIGLGEIGSNVACNLREFEGEVYLFNRSKDKADKSAAEYGFQSCEFSALNDYIPEMDVVISSVQMDKPLLYKTHFNSLSPQLIIDLGVPRNVHAEVETLASTTLLNVDDLNEKVQTALAMRKSEIPVVNAIIKESILEFNSWKQEKEVFPIIQQLKTALEDIRKQELARHLGKLDEQQSEVLESITNGMIQKIIKLPVLELKAACKRGDSESLVEVLQDLFNLEKTTV